jgi:hypothetical protein
VDSTNSTQFSRRRFLQATGATAAAGLLAGCTTGTEDDTTPRSTSTAPNTIVETSSETEPLEQTHAVEDLDTVVQELEQDAVSLNFHPADPDAEYADSVLFTEYSGELDVKIDLEQAEKQRHHNQISTTAPQVQEFKNNILDEEWRQQLAQEADVKNPQDLLDWDTYTDESLSYRERMTESGMVNFWYAFESEKFDGISSTNNQYKAAALQETETQLGFDTFIWDYGIPGHGLVSAIENPTRNEENTESQETYIIETDFTDRQQITKWENSQYQNTELHPAREGVERRKKGFYLRTAVGKDEYEYEETYNMQMKSIEQFIEFFRNPESSPAYDHLDPMTATAYTIEENIINGELDGKVVLGTNTIKFQA